MRKRLAASLVVFTALLAVGSDAGSGTDVVLQVNDPEACMRNLYSVYADVPWWSGVDDTEVIEMVSLGDGRAEQRAEGLSASLNAHFEDLSAPVTFLLDDITGALSLMTHVLRARSSQALLPTPSYTIPAGCDCDPLVDQINDILDEIDREFDRIYDYLNDLEWRISQMGG